MSLPETTLASVLLVLPVVLGLLVIGRLIITAVKAAKAKISPQKTRGPAGPVIPLLDQPFPCPTCEKLEFVHVARSDFRELNFVEHLVCHGCGTQFLGPNQEAMVAKRLEARQKMADVFAGKPPAKKLKKA